MFPPFAIANEATFNDKAQRRHDGLLDSHAGMGLARRLSCKANPIIVTNRRPFN